MLVRKVCCGALSSAVLVISSIFSFDEAGTTLLTTRMFRTKKTVPLFLLMR